MTNRALIRISGPDARSFLQGLVTNDVEKLSGGGLVYAAMLTPQGKLIADFFLVPEEGQAVLLDVAAPLADGLVQRLSMYRLRADVEIERVGDGVFCGTGEAPEGAFADPRCAAMGWRLYGQESGTDGSDFNALRVAHAIPESGVELGPESYILEMGFERLNGVDFAKGCYVGQEVTARMKHKTTLRKGLARVSIEGAADMGEEILSDGKTVGVLHSRADDMALAYLRYDRATGPLTCGEASLVYTPELQP